MTFRLSSAEADRLIAFYREGIRTRSYSDEEGPYARLIETTMKMLGFDEVFIDKTGNVAGRVGNGVRVIHFDGHMDTVKADNPDEWKADPFAADFVAGEIVGRGSVDMKGGLSAAIFAAASAKKAGLLVGKTVWITGSVCEEYCDGVCLTHFYQNTGLRPDICVICEPSGNQITLGHTGKVQVPIKTHGISAHGSAPEKGLNAVYEMAEIITRVEKLNAELHAAGGGTIVLSDISSVSASLNAVPSACSIYLDRRLRVGETVAQVKTELDRLVAGKRAHWEPGTLVHTSWTGDTLVYDPTHEPWKIAEDDPLTKTACAAYRATFGDAPLNFNFWDFGTNAVVPVSMGIKTIGFGPGAYKLAHMTDERCRPEDVAAACEFYVELIRRL